MDILSLLREPWPWYVAGPLIGLVVPALLVLGNERFGLSENLRHACAMLPSRVPFFRYDWRSRGGRNLAVALGIVAGGFVGGVPLADPDGLRLAADTRVALAEVGLAFDGAFVPLELFGASALGQASTLVFLLVGGALVGFGARYAGGCTSGHAITGLADRQLPSLVAVAGFFVGGLLATHLLLPVLL